MSADSSMTASEPTTTPSAGTTSPARTTTMSPGRSSLTSISDDRVAVVAVRDARRPLDEQAELTACTSGGPRLERCASGHHQRDDRCGEVLAEGERPDDRNERDRVDADVSPQQ